MELKMTIEILDDRNRSSDNSCEFNMIVKQSETIAPGISSKALNTLLDKLFWFTKFYFINRFQNELIRIANRSSKKKEARNENET